MTPTAVPPPFHMLRSTIGKAKILIVDDEQANVRLLERILELIGATRIVSITDSREAVANFIDFRPDLVLLDLHMPNVTGFDIMEQIKALTQGENPVPVLVLTADVTTKTKHRALAAGRRISSPNRSTNRKCSCAPQPARKPVFAHPAPEPEHPAGRTGPRTHRAVGGYAFQAAPGPAYRHPPGAAERARHDGRRDRPRFQQRADAHSGVQRPAAFHRQKPGGRGRDRTASRHHDRRAGCRADRAPSAGVPPARRGPGNARRAAPQPDRRTGRHADPPEVAGPGAHAGPGDRGAHRIRRGAADHGRPRRTARDADQPDFQRRRRDARRRVHQDPFATRRRPRRSCASRTPARA